MNEEINYIIEEMCNFVDNPTLGIKTKREKKLAGFMKSVIREFGARIEVAVAKMETTTSEANDCRKAREVLTRVHEFLSNLCRDARCDAHCSECIGASDLADDVYDVLEGRQELGNPEKKGGE